MSVQYRCRNEKRRQAVRKHATLNGIDFLEMMLDNPTLLLLHCFKSIPSKYYLQIESDSNSHPVHILWSCIATLPRKDPPQKVNNEESDYLNSLDDRDKILIIRTDSGGDFSSYRLILSDNKDPSDFDPRLSEMDFSFKIDCSNDLDCLAKEVCPPEPSREPPINYLAKDYASFRKLILDRLSIIQPSWKERNAADLEMALVELLSYAGDQLSYYQDAVATEAYLNTARKRVSIRRHVRLLDYTVHEGCNARAWVCFELEEEGGPVSLNRQDAVKKSRTRFLTHCQGQPVVEPGDFEQIMRESNPEIFEPLHNATLYPSHNHLCFYTWDEDECCLPKGSIRATLLYDPNNPLQLQKGDVLLFEERIGSTGLEEDADTSHSHPVRLTKVDKSFDHLTQKAIVEIEWHTDDALPFPLCISSKIQGKLIQNMSWARGNVVLADHGLTVDNGQVLPAQVPEQGPYRPHLEQGPLTFRTAYENSEPMAVSASSVIEQDPREALPEIELVEDDSKAAWNVRRDLLSSDRFAHDFVIEAENDGRVHLRFGDGLLGEEPDPGVTFSASYRIGNGGSGNVGAGAIAHLVPSEGSLSEMKRIKRVWNPMPAQGGIDPEPLSQIRLYAPVAFRRQERAVTEEDYAEMAMRHPEVKKAVATLRWTGSWYTAFITVDRRNRQPVDREFREELSEKFLERFRLAGYDIEVNGPQFVPIDIAFSVRAAQGYLPEHVKSSLMERFSSSYLTDGRKGFFHPDNFTFGQPVYLSQVIAAAMEVPGVTWIDASNNPSNRFRRWGHLQGREIDEGIIKLNRLEIVLLENDTSHPENGKLEFFMEGGL